MQVVVFVQTASDFSSVFSVSTDEIFYRAAVGDIALTAAAHQKLGARTGGFF